MSKTTSAVGLGNSENYLKSLIKQSAFGFGADDAVLVANSILEKKDSTAILFTLACVNQIKRNVVVAFDIVEAVKRDYPKLGLEKVDRSSDGLNMGACRLTGYVFLHMASFHVLARKMLSKSGSPLLGVPGGIVSAGAKINQELYSEIGPGVKIPAGNDAQVKLITNVLDSAV